MGFPETRVLGGGKVSPMPKPVVVCWVFLKLFILNTVGVLKPPQNLHTSAAKRIQIFSQLNTTWRCKCIGGKKEIRRTRDGTFVKDGRSLWKLLPYIITGVDSLILPKCTYTQVTQTHDVPFLTTLSYTSFNTCIISTPNCLLSCG